MHFTTIDIKVPINHTHILVYSFLGSHISILLQPILVFPFPTRDIRPPPLTSQIHIHVPTTFDQPPFTCH